MFLLRVGTLSIFLRPGNFMTPNIWIKLKLFYAKEWYSFQKNLSTIDTANMHRKSICNNIETGHFSIRMTAITLKLTIQI